MPIESSSTIRECEKEGHCFHEGTAIGSFYCCHCGQYLCSLSNKLGFYEDRPIARMGGCFRVIRETEFNGYS